MGVKQGYSTLDDIIALAEFAHRNGQDQAGEPYIRHPMRVLRRVQARGARPYVQMAAVLHDVTEDTKFTCDMLLTLGVPEAAVDIVRLVDRAHSKNVWIAEHWDGELDLDSQVAKELIDMFYYAEIRKSEDATIVKDEDMGDNSEEWRLVYLKPERQTKLRAKYTKGRSLLHD